MVNNFSFWGLFHNVRIAVADNNKHGFNTSHPPSKKFVRNYFAAQIFISFQKLERSINRQLSIIMVCSTTWNQKYYVIVGNIYIVNTICTIFDEKCACLPSKIKSKKSTENKWALSRVKHRSSEIILLKISCVGLQLPASSVSPMICK
jgi:hypothetical protein